jgi:transposase
MFLPTYSSQLNPIESVWNVIKHEWRKTQHMHALLEFDDQKERTRHSIGRLQAIIGKEVFNINRFTLTAEDEEDCSLPSSVHGSLH